MIRGLLRFLAYTLAFWFVYRVVVGALRHIVPGDRRKSAGEPPAQPDQKSAQQKDYRDVKDAHFKDLPPGDSSNPS